ncbi:MAG: metal ABC transporter substrate-binding protein [Fimbriimonadales bacterium]|nr:metal ABC transporter substrate-binding protein [Fimbriimonadales bacterium]
MYAATLSVVADWLRGLELPFTLIQPRSADAHETSLTVRMVQQALRARRVIAIGGGLEGYLPTLQRALQGRTPVSELIEHLQPPPDNLHIWLDVRYARQSCAQILHWATADGLAGVNQRQAWVRMQLQLRQIEARIREAGAVLQGKVYLAVHDAYLPLTRRLGMRSVGSLQPDHERPPSLQRLRDAVEQGRREGVAMVLASEPSDIGATVAQILRVPLVIADTLESPDPEHDYFARFLGLLRALEQAVRRA